MCIPRKTGGPAAQRRGAQILETVSRVHARTRYDDQSTCGTSVVREDYRVPIQVKQHPVALQDGDLRYFGRACLRCSIGRRR